MLYVQIVECPKDFTLFWMHTSKEKLQVYKELYPEKFKDLDIRSENRERIKIR
jgi:hypothetical protein